MTDTNQAAALPEPDPKSGPPASSLFGLKIAPKSGVILAMFFTVAATIALGDLVSVEILPLAHLGIVYLPLIMVCSLAIPSAVFLSWMFSKWNPIVGGIALVAGLVVMLGLAQLSSMFIDRVPVTSWLDNPEIVEQMESHLGFRISPIADSTSGAELLVARGNGPATIAEAKRLGIYRP